MYDIERITKIIKDIEKYENELKGFQIKSSKDLEEPKNLHASAMVCFAILNRVIDLGQMILVKEEQGMPSRYSEIFENLAKAGVLNKEEAEKINNLIDYRNIIAHNYYDTTPKETYKVLSSLGLIDKFIEQVKKRVTRK